MCLAEEKLVRTIRKDYILSYECIQYVPARLWVIVQEAACCLNSLEAKLERLLVVEKRIGSARDEIDKHGVEVCKALSHTS